MYAILYGVPVCDASVRVQREQMFDERVTETAADKSSDTESDQTFFTGVKDPIAESSLGIARPTTLSAVGDSNGPATPGLLPFLTPTPRHAFRLRQKRVRFGANMISPLVRQNLNTNRDRRSGSVDINITRTVPVLWCRSGGMDNYHKTPSREHIYRGLRKSWKVSDDKHASEARKSRVQHNKHVRGSIHSFAYICCGINYLMVYSYFIF